MNTSEDRVRYTKDKVYKEILELVDYMHEHKCSKCGEYMHWESLTSICDDCLLDGVQDD